MVARWRCTHAIETIILVWGFLIYQNKGWEGGVIVTVDDATDSELQCRIIELEGDGKPSQRTDVVSLCGRLILGSPTRESSAFQARTSPGLEVTYGGPVST